MTRSVSESGAQAELDLQSEKAARWAAFSSARPFAERVSAWLALLVLRLPSARGARVYRRQAAADAFTTMATWEGGSETPVAEFERSARRGFARSVALVRSYGRFFHLVVQPEGYPDWVVVVECLPVQPRELQTALDELRWGSGWLVAGVEQVAGREAKASARRYDLAVKAGRGAGSAREVVSASAAVAEAVAATLSGTLVSVGVFRHNVLTLAGRAGQTPADSAEDDARRETLVRLAIAQGSAVVAGALPENEAAAAAGVAPENGVRVVAWPLMYGGHCAGVLLCERLAGPGFDTVEMEMLEEAAAQVAPFIAEKPVSRSTVVTRPRRVVAGLFGQVRLQWKVAAIALLAAVLFVLGATGDYEAPVTVVVEGNGPKKVYAPFDGRLAEVHIRTGDAVRRGQVLARYDDAELQIEKVKLTSERERLAAPPRLAADGTEIPPTEAQTARRREIEARLAAIEDKLGRLQIVSPYDGTVQSAVSGQSRMALRAEDPLFAIVQVEGYRLQISAAHGDAETFAEGQTGRARIGGEEVPFRISRVGASEDGAEVRAEAQALQLGPQIHPGMQGTGTVDAGTRKLVWIWWRKLRQPAAG